MDYDALVTFAQEHFTDGLALVIGSGLSAAEGIPGMSALATHLSNGAGLLTETAATLWCQIKAVLDAGGGLEAALLEHAQPLNLDRMRAATAGGTWRNWDDNLISPCHKAATGKGYASVYGRIEWDTPSPTITTQFFGFGNGRFGHLAGEAGSQPVTRLLPIGGHLTKRKKSYAKAD